MGGIDDWEVTNNEKLTLVLLGRTGNGKSATGNSILGSKEFNSKCSSNGVSTTCELKTTRLDNGLIIDVIDTPGLFDFTGEPDVIGKEIVKCMELAMDGIDAVLLVLSVRTRFSREELAAIQCFQEFFGEKIRDYMIIVFTGGDELDDSDEALDDYLGKDCPEPLKETIKLCDDRFVLFDNRTKDPKKKEDQLNKLLSLVTLVLQKNNEVPYTNELFKKLKALKAKGELNEPLQMSYEEHFVKLTENFTSLLKEITNILFEQWAIERADRIAEKQKAEAAFAKSVDEMRELREQFERLQSDSSKGGCHIL
ncbi:hypothetical protein EJD97_013066 [Solanum chilense]|uniref:AIG1-type G domain-containing protein n=1 Tax=Solanum chilense TaxID=4083 RepID=A0A6N2BCL8_SOLCI|nr:hypothetical protein EJD97_013066 [Solanum chilense]